MPFCPNCGREVSTGSAFCPSCGASLNATSYSPPPVGTVTMLPQKSEGEAVLLALILGLFGLWGVGHMYAGKVGKGIVLLVAGLIFGGLFWVSIILTIILIGFVGIVLFGIVLFVGWLWQTYDAYKTTKAYNDIARQTGRAPW